MSGTRVLAAVLGLWILMRAITKDATGRTLIDHLLQRQASQSPLLNAGITNTAATPIVPAGGQVNPVPGAVGNRLDQGFDLTSKSFLAPFTGKVLVSNQSDPGWKGGGYLAVQSQTNPSQVIYIAEGIQPSVAQGAIVQAGEPIGIPVSNPYNGAIGNVEIGPANPKNPAQPLAQAVSNKAGVVQQFYNWLRGLGGPQATSTSLAGYP